MGWVFVLTGLAVGAAPWLDTKPVPNREAVIVAGAVFFLGGLQLVTGAKGRGSFLMGGLVCAGLSFLGFWAAFSKGPVSGGIPFIPYAWNQTLGKTLFGGGALLTAAAAAWFLAKALKQANRPPA